MMNPVIFKNLIDRYNALSYTHHYMFGFADKGVVYCAVATADLLPYVCTLDAGSRGVGYALRFKPTKAQVEVLKSCETFVVCSLEYLEAEFKACKYNRGEVFEKLVTEHFGQEWVKDNVPFTKAGDIVVDGVHYQIKYNKATFCNEQSLANLEK